MYRDQADRGCLDGQRLSVFHRQSQEPELQGRWKAGDGTQGTRAETNGLSHMSSQINSRLTVTSTAVVIYCLMHSRSWIWPQVSVQRVVRRLQVTCEDMATFRLNSVLGHIMTNPTDGRFA